MFEQFFLNGFNHFNKYFIGISSGVVQAPIFSIFTGYIGAVHIASHCNHNICRRNVRQKFASLCFFHINPVELFHNAHGILVDLRFCLRPCGITFKYIRSKIFPKRFCNLTSAGIMHTDKCYFWFCLHLSTPHKNDLLNTCFGFVLFQQCRLPPQTQARTQAHDCKFTLSGGTYIIGIHPASLKAENRPARAKRRREKGTETMANRILLVEDNSEISEMLKDYLTAENYEVVCAADGQEACALFQASEFDLVLLDLMIPKISGMEVMKQIRKTSIVPIIIVSAKDTETDKTLGLGLGADDYITKPFSVVEVLARIKSNIRRAKQYAPQPAVPAEPAILTAGDLTLNPEDYTAVKAGKKIDLTAKEFEILKLLMKNPKKVYTKEQLYSLVWNDAYMGDENAVNVHISRLRNKIEEDPRRPKYILTVWGIGYKLGDFT